MSAERNAGFLGNEDSISMYDSPLGEVPAVPIGYFAHTDGNGHKRPEGEVEEMKDVASRVGAETTDRPHGEHSGTVIRHKAWLWVGGALATAMGVTAAGLGTAFAIEHHRRKHRK